jgi:hypothetical protein
LEEASPAEEAFKPSEYGIHSCVILT